MTSASPEVAGVNAARASFRPDIEGLRAVAIGLVLLYHGGLDQLTGGFVGVDVFFVISGFLITGLLIRELEKSGQVSLRRFYARRAKRLLPATAVVLVSTAFLTWITVSVVDWRAFGGDIVSAALYIVNWRLAARSVDYLAEGIGVSPVQHFWSLAVEEQFYLVWPLLLVAIAWWVRRRARARLRAVMTVGILIILAPSLVYSIVLTQANPAAAFFITPTRLWELGIGALIAIGSQVWPRLPRAGASILGWAGLAIIAVSGFAFSAETAWPGYYALAPTLGTAAVIVAGFAAGRAGPGVLLSTRAAVWVGGLSYSLYLWHWPLIVCATALWGELGTKRGLLVILLSFIPAYLCHRLVENPIRFARTVSASNSYALSLGATFTLVGVVAGLVLQLAVPRNTDIQPGQQVALGAAILADPAGSPAGGNGTIEALSGIDWYVPEALNATKDVPAAYARSCQSSGTETIPVACEYGDTNGDVTIAVVGDSKILQWISAIDEVASREGWRVVLLTRSACHFAAAPRVLDGAIDELCVEWNDNVLEELVDLHPDIVLTSQRTRVALADPADLESGSQEAMVDGLVDRWSYLIANSIDVAVLLDNPAPVGTGEVYECVADHPDDLAACTFSREAGIDSSAARVQASAASRFNGEVGVVDMTDVVCPSADCVPIIGNVLIYRQGSHLTDTYVRSATQALAEQLVPIVEAAVS